MVTKKPVVRKRLVPDPGALSAMARAVSVALTILETTKLPSWRELADAVRQGEPKANSNLLTLEIEPDIAELLAGQGPILDLIRYGPGAGGRKPTTTTLLTCTVCARWLIGSPTSGTPACVLTTDCTGKLASAKKATKVGPQEETGPAPMPAPIPEPVEVVDSPSQDGIGPAEQGETYTEEPGMFD